MEQSHFLRTVRDALRCIREPRLFKTERGFQGELLARLKECLGQFPIWPGDVLVEQEYQKREKEHGLALRPDIIVHAPFERGNIPNRQQGNYAVLQLKLRGSLKAALDDYEKLALMCSVLDYQMGIFINIDSDNTYFANYEGEARSRLCAFAVELRNEEVVIRESVSERNHSSSNRFSSE